MNTATTVKLKKPTPSSATAGSACYVSCPLCDGEGEITNPEHPSHPKQTHDGEDETWCLACDGAGQLKVKSGVVVEGRYEGEKLTTLKKWRKADGTPNC